VADGGQGRIPPEIKDILLKLRRAHTHTHREKVALLFIAMIDIKQLS